MRKLREEKGFAMAELLAVCIVVLGIFAILFSNYLPLTAEYENRVTYNNVNAEYAATYIRKIFKDVKVYDALKGLDSGGYYTLYSCSSDDSCVFKDGIFTKSDGSSRNNTYDEKKKQVTKFINEYGIQEIIITKYKTKEVKEKYSESGLLYNYIKSLSSFSDSKVTKTGKYRIILKTKDYGYATVPLRYAEPNEPKLDSDMLPVYYDNGSWKVADKTNESVTNEWYDYVEKKWANAVKLSSGSVSSYKAGDVVLLSNIKSMWVWIPKYKYEDFESDTVKQIDVTFLTSEYTGDDAHPAFTGNAKNGFWIGKYEGSNDNKIINGGMGNASAAVGSGDITNYEWGAVAYLAYSKYGTCSETDNGKIVCSGVSQNTSFKTGAGGTDSSTTLNYYGVFDMNGGRFEIVNGAGNKGDGTGSSSGTDSELKKRGSTTYKDIYSKKYFHKFIHDNACVSCCGRCNSCGSGENYDSCCYVTYYVCSRYDCEQRTNNAYTESCNYWTGAREKTYESSDTRSANGNLYYNWGKTTYADDCLSASSNKLNLRGGFAEGNAFCIKTNETISGTVEDQSKYLYGDTTGTNKHYSIAKNYNGIFSYSSSEYVRQEYITHRSVIRDQ